MKRFIIALIIGVAVFSMATASPAAEKPAKAPATAKARQANGLPFRGKISAVDKAAQTISLAGRDKARTFHLTAQTKISKDGQPITLNDLAVGESVGGYAVKNATGDSEVVTLNVRSAAKTKTKEAK